MPKISIIIPIYNAEKHLRECLNSVISQTLRDIEIICVDDGSVDKSMEIIEEYASQDNRFIILKQENSGPSKARNFGWDSAKSDYIAFIDSDDVWHPEKLWLQYQYMIKNYGIYYSCHKKIVLKGASINEFNNMTPKVCHIIKMKPFRLLFKHYSNGATSSFMLKNVDDIRFDIRKKHSEDYLLTLQLLFKYKGVFLDCELSASFKETYGDGGLSEDLWKMEQGDLNTFNVLREQGYIGIFTYLSASIFSLVKYLRRCFICLVR